MVKKEFYKIDVKEIFESLCTNKNGLTTNEVKKRLEKYGPNKLKERKKETPIKIFLRQFKSFLILILIFAAIISSLIGFLTKNPEDFIDTFVILSIVILNACLGFFQEYKAEKTLEALKKLAAPKAKVIRAGKKIKINSEELVPGDIILLEIGDRIPTDSRLIEEFNFYVNESTLTGESVPVKKQIQKIEKEVPVFEQKNMAFMGTIVTCGKAQAVVTSTGMQTEFGKIAELVQVIEEKETPLQKKLDITGKTLGFIIIFICAIIFLLGIFRKVKLIEMFLVSVSLAVAAVPEGLPAVVTITLALGLMTMAKSNAIIRKLPAVETLGSVSVICADKTGTLTKDEMTVREISVGNKLIEVTGSGYNPIGELKFQEKFNYSDKLYLELLLKAGALCNNSELIKEEDKWNIFGDPTEGALVVLAKKADFFDLDKLKKEFPRIYEIEFSSERKMMTTLHKVANNKKLITFSKGAPEILLENCKFIYENGKVVKLNPKYKKLILNRTQEMAKKALRVLGFAYKELPINSRPKFNSENLESDLIFVGITGMIDPPRDEVFDAIKKCLQAGIRPIMITGDHKLTATAIAKELNLANGEVKVLTGEELDRLNDKELEKEAREVSVYARVSPAHKVRILEALKTHGHIVAMTGDGVNDAPALKKSDIGVAMGITGTDVTKEVSDMVLEDDNFATIVKAVEQGRKIYENIKKFVFYLLSTNIGEILVIFIAALINLPLPLIAVQILWINLLTDGLPAVSLGVEPIEPGIMKKPPRNPKEKIISKNMIANMLFVGIIMCIGTLGIFYLNLSKDLIRARTLGFSTLVLFQIFNVLNAKSEKESIFKIGFFSNLYLIVSIIISIAMLFAVIYIPILQNAFKTFVLSAKDWIYVFLVSASVFIIMEIKKLFERIL